MRKLTTFLIALIIVLAIAAGGKFLRENLNRYSRDLTALAEQATAGASIQVKEISFSRAEISSPDTVTWYGVQARIRFSENTALLQKQTLALTISQIRFTALDLFDNEFLILMDGIETANETQTSPGDRFTFSQGKLHLKLTLDLFHPKSVQQQLKTVMAEASEIFRYGKTRVPMNCNGLLTFSLPQGEANAILKTTMDPDGYYVLVINEDFFKNTAWLMEEEITDAEAELLSRHPFKLKKLIGIMQTARHEARSLAREQGISQDAYRHVLWSYLLTTEYGPEFAKAFTDAHEIGDLTNTQAEHEMDYNNNAIGREYAAMGIPRHQILSRFLNDPHVIRRPRN